MSSEASENLVGLVELWEGGGGETGWRRGEFLFSEKHYCGACGENCGGGLWHHRCSSRCYSLTKVYDPIPPQPLQHKTPGAEVYKAVVLHI